MGNDPVNNVDPDGGSIGGWIRPFLQTLNIVRTPTPMAAIGQFSGVAQPTSLSGSTAAGSTAAGTSGGGSTSGGLLNSLGNAAASALGQWVANKLLPMPSGPDAGQLQQSDPQSITTNNSTNTLDLSHHNEEDGGNSSTNDDWIDLDKPTLLTLTSTYFCPCPDPPKNCQWKNDGQLDNAAGYVLENTWNKFMEQAPTYMPNTIGLNILGVEPDGFGSAISGGLDGIRIDALTHWYEVKASGRNSLPLSYSQISGELNAMGLIYKPQISRGVPVFFHLITPSNVLFSETRSSIIKRCKDLGLNFAHYIPQYKMANGMVNVRFILKANTSGFKSVLGIYQPVPLQGSGKTYLCK